MAIGVDSHKSTLAAVAVDEVGRVLERRELRNEPTDHRRFIGWVGALGDARIGIECCGAYGAALARTLCSADLDVVEVPTFMAQREARRTPSRGKADFSDAEAIARVVARGEPLPVPAVAGTSEDLKLLSEHRDQLQRRRTKLINRVHKHLVIHCPGYEQRIPSLTKKGAGSQVLRLLRGDRSVRAELVREAIAEIRRLEGKVAKLDRDIAARLAESGSSLTSLCGIGTTVAATILGEVGDIRRFRSAAAFAMFCGAAPLPASSGKTNRHSLNRRCNRKLNRALWVMAVVQARSHGPAGDYVARKISEGKSYREGIRCLKRLLANVIYRQMVEDVRRPEAA